LERVGMVDVLVFIHRDASLARCDEIARELQEGGFKLKAKYASVGIIAGSVEDRSVLTRFKDVKDVTQIMEQ
jgi:hypothetical protein